jgi:hypothetical protein
MKPLTDTELRQRGMEVLGQALGLVESERFVVLMAREPFDYTAWRSGLFPGKSVAELSATALALRKKPDLPPPPRSRKNNTKG